MFLGRRDALLLSILTLVTALAWIAFDVYHASIQNTIPQDVEAKLVPITPTFDRPVVDGLKTRFDVAPLEGEIVKPATGSATP